jgi:glycosyltransferase involved in cell wall biosynthesis
MERSMINKPRLLFLSYAFPPINSIACVRAYNIAKWLTRKDWEVTVVTPYESAWARSDGTVDLHEELSRQGIRCMRTGHRWRSLLPSRVDRRRYGVARVVGGVSRRIAAFRGIERETGWIGEAAKACAGLAPEDVDVILASGPPFGSFGLAKEIAERLGRPYVLDYRDLWTGNPHATRSAPTRMIDRERIILAASAATIGISPSLSQSLQDQFGMRRNLHIITNGFDPEEMAQITKHNFGHFAIVYTGQFYPPKRTVWPLMAAFQKMDRLSEQPKDWAFHYYGYQGDYVRGVARDFRVEHRVVVHGGVPRPEALAAVRGANIAVIITSVYEHGSLQDKGIVTGKIFDAIGVGTPFLAIAPAGSDLEGVLAVTGLGERFAGTETDRIARFLQNAMNGGTPRSRRPEPFSWTNLSEQLNGLLREVLAAKG